MQAIFASLNEQSRNKAIIPPLCKYCCLTNSAEVHPLHPLLTGFHLLPLKQLLPVLTGRLSTLNFQLRNGKQKLHLTKHTSDPATRLYLALLWFSHGQIKENKHLAWKLENKHPILWANWTSVLLRMGAPEMPLRKHLACLYYLVFVHSAFCRHICKYSFFLCFSLFSFPLFPSSCFFQIQEK